MPGAPRGSRGLPAPRLSAIPPPCRTGPPRPANSHAAHPSLTQGRVRSPEFRGMHRGGSTGLQRRRIAPWRCVKSACAPCSRQASISATRPAAGTRGWRPTSSASATTSTSSTSSRPCRCMERALRAVRDTVAGRRARAVRRHQAPAAEYVAECGHALRPVLRQPPLARRHADQLEDHLGLDQAPEADGRASGR